MRSEAILVVVASFCCADLGHDLLVVPTRAAMNDLFDADTAERRAALAGGFGKLCALFLAANLPSRSAWLSASAILGTLTFVQVLAPAAPAGEGCADDASL